MSTEAGRVADALDYLDITRLQAAYGDAVTRRAWAEFDDMFAPEAEVILDLRAGEPRRFMGGAAIAEFIAASIERFDFFEFALLNAVVNVTPGASEATGRMYIWEIRQDAASGAASNAYGVYDDRYQRVDGRWVFAARRYSSLARTGPLLQSFPVPPRPTRW